MPNNFKLRGDFYVSKAGNDANAGTSPDAPLLTIQAALDKITTAVTRVIVVGTGVYRENISKTLVGGCNISILADGNCVIEGKTGSAIDSFYITTEYAVAAITLNFNGFEIRNYNSFTFNPARTFTFMYFNNCIIKNTKIICPWKFSPNNGPYMFLYFYKNIFINCEFIRYALDSEDLLNSNLSCDSCIFINTSCTSFPTYGVFYGQFLTAGVFDELKNCYIDSNSTVSYYVVIWIAVGGNYTLYNIKNVSNFSNNNNQGKIIAFYSGSVLGGAAINTPLTVTQYKQNYPNIDINSFSSDPKFNNPKLLDFTLQAGSPNVSASANFSTNVGGTQYAVTYTASSAAFTTNATSQSLEYRGLYYSISGSAVSGSITSGPMFLQWPRTKPMTSINWMGALDFNKTITASFAGNTNVPAYTTYTSASGQAGANPDRLKIAMRFSTQQTQPSTDAEWDNNGYWTAGTYQLFEINQKPTIDYKGTGNGDPTYAGSSAIGDLVPSWIQTEIILRNDYNR